MHGSSVLCDGPLACIIIPVETDIHILILQVMLRLNIHVKVYEQKVCRGIHVITSTQQLTEGKQQHLAVHVQRHLHRTHTHRERSTGLWLVICSPPIMTLIYLKWEKVPLFLFFPIFTLHELVYMIVVHYDTDLTNIRIIVKYMLCTFLNKKGNKK